MASNVIVMTRKLAVVQIVIGLLLLSFGIGDRCAVYASWTGRFGFGIWIGIWVLLTGFLGIDGTKRGRTMSGEAFLKQNGGVFMGFSITSAVFAGIIIICYVPTIIIYQNENHGYKWRYDEEGQQYRVKINPKNGYEEQMAISAALLALGVIEFGIGIWSAICCCVIKCCMATTPSHQELVMVYPVNSQMTSACVPGTMIKDNPPEEVEMPPPYEQVQCIAQSTSV